MSTGLSVVRELPTKDPTDQPGLANHCSEADESSDEEKAIRLDESAVGGEEEDGVEHEPNAAVCTFARNSPSACVL